MLEPISNTIHDVFDFTWPMLLISTIIIVVFRLTYIIKNKQKFVLFEELLKLSFCLYILCLFQVVTFEYDVSWATNNFIPFKEILRYNITSHLFFKNVLGNMILFLPFGFYTSYYLKVDKIKIPFLLTFIASISIEVVQMCIGRVFDVDDIILNVIGGVLGYYIYSILRIIIERLPRFCRSEWFLNIVALIALIITILIII